MIILCADDYAMTEGISRAIGELAAARRLSATSVLVTARQWPHAAPRLAVHRGRLSVGLHLNLTSGTPLGPMPQLAKTGRFPSLRGLIMRALAGLLDGKEIEAEISRQLDSFEGGVRFPPDHIDGHQHVHVLPGIRGALLRVVSQRYPGRAPLIRDPSDRIGAIMARRSAIPKAMAACALATGFGNAARSLGLRTNDSFAGFSDFDVNTPFTTELGRALLAPAQRHIIMCHPGHADAELATLDAVVERRAAEYAALMGDLSIADRIWRPSRSTEGAPLDWSLPIP
jgi:chitin disaccharide deacetylase